MLKSTHTPIIIAVLALTFAIVACGAFPASQPPAEEQGVDVSATPEPPTNSPSVDKTDTSTTITCAQLLPDDEINLLLNHTPATLNENANQGSITCSWEYTPNGGTQQNSFEIQADYSTNAVQNWNNARQTEISKEASDTVVISINGLGQENYTWVSPDLSQRVVYVSTGSKTLIMRFQPADIIYLQTESGMIDYIQRIFNRF